MYEHVLLAAALQRWDKPSPHALAARDAVALATGAEARLSVLSIYEYENINIPDLASAELGRYREAQMQRMDAVMEQKMKAFLDGVPIDGLAITPVLKRERRRHMACDPRPWRGLYGPRLHVGQREAIPLIMKASRQAVGMLSTPELRDVKALSPCWSTGTPTQSAGLSGSPSRQSGA